MQCRKPAAESVDVYLTTYTKQIARLSALWARKAVSPFWRSKSEKNDAAARFAA